MFETLVALGALAAYDVVAIETSHPHPSVTRVEYAMQVGPDPLDHFSIVNVTPRGPRNRARETLILLSPFTLPAEFWEISETDDYERSFAGRLARSRIDVWLVGQRQTGLPPGTCEATPQACQAMGGWDFHAYSNDALLALWLTKITGRRGKPVLGGFSAGSNAALATVNRAPNAFSGVVLYEGTFFTHDPELRAHNDPICTTLEASLDAGAVFDPSVGVLGLVLQLAAADPEGLSPLPFFPPGTSNQLAALLVFGAPPPPGAIAPTPGYIRNLADFESQSFVYTDQARLERVGPLFDNYASVAALRDLHCGLAGRDTTYVDNLDAFEGDVLVLVEGTGFGPAMFDTAALFENARSVTIDSNPEFGEADPYFHERWEQVLYRPLRRWMR